jgi:hypothetical protein
MKTIKKGTEIKRVKNKEAEKLTKQDWKYCPKSEYKKQKKEEK